MNQREQHTYQNPTLHHEPIQKVLKIGNFVGGDHDGQLLSRLPSMAVERATIALGLQILKDLHVLICLQLDAIQPVVVIAGAVLCVISNRKCNYC